MTHSDTPGESAVDGIAARSADVLPTVPDSRWSAARARIAGLKGPIVALAAVGTVLGGLAGYWNSYRTVRASVAPTIAGVAPAVDAMPYSAADRRMTFAVLPFVAPTGDVEAARLAQDAFDATQAKQESRTLWARVAPSALVSQAVATPASLRQLGQALDVHFLLRGNVTRTAAGYTLDLTVLDAASESPLASRNIAAKASGAMPRIPGQQIDDALGWLTFAALKHEVASARAKPDARLDVRDLSFRAYADMSDEHSDRPAAYSRARQSLDRALAMAPSDPLALFITARINLCECLRTWAHDTKEMERIGEAALDKYLAIVPDSLSMLELRSHLLLKHGRAENALLILEQVLAREPDRSEATASRVVALFKLGQHEQALAAIPAMLQAADHKGTQAIAAAVHFANGDDAEASRLARMALVQSTAAERADALTGVVALVLVAAEWRARHPDRAKAALRNFHAAVPHARTIAQIKAWRLPHAVLPDSDAFWQALQQAGLEP